MINQYIKSIGLEIECGCDLGFLYYIKKNFNIKFSADASVNVENPDYLTYSANNLPRQLSEAWIYNLEIKYHSSDYNQLVKFINTVFNDSYLWQNSSCGNHIHVKFTKNYYLTYFYTFSNVKRFIQMYVNHAKRMLDADKYLARLSNSYCKEICSIEDILSNYNSDRYYMLNIQCNRKHKRSGFLEFRIFPYVTDKMEYLSNLNFLISAITEILQGIPSKYTFKI
jgi:hypothetical protein